MPDSDPTDPGPPFLVTCPTEVVSVFRREQALERRCPGLLKSHPSRGLLHGNTMEKLIKKRNVPQKLSPHSKRWDQSEVPRFEKGKRDAGAAGRLNIYMGRDALYYPRSGNAFT